MQNFEWGNLREYRKTDESFIYHSWLHSLPEDIHDCEVDCKPDCGLRGKVKLRSGEVLSKGRYFYGHHHKIEEILKRSKIIIACAKDDPDTIIGWVCLQQDGIVHYTYVKECWRRQGVGRTLIDAVREVQNKDNQELSYTHDTMLAPAFSEAVKATHNPFLLEET